MTQQKEPIVIDRETAELINPFIGPTQADSMNNLICVLYSMYDLVAELRNNPSDKSFEGARYIIDSSIRVLEYEKELQS